MASDSTRSRTLLAPYLGLVDRVYWGFRPSAMPYFRLLDRIHQQVMPRTYLEIGVSTGGSMTLSLPGTVNVGVDPEPKISQPVSADSKIYTEKSDDFFAAHDLNALLGGQQLDLAFIDGMHHFEFALRDFMNIERRASPLTTVLIHDCYPIDEVTADRIRPPGKWSGDIWKLIVCLKEARPDLKISVVDVGPTGLGVITGLDPSSPVLEDRYEELVARFLEMPYRLLEDGDKATILNRVPYEWATVRDLLPSQPFRDDPLALVVTRRALRAGWPVARRVARRQAASLSRRLRPR
jgi:hypothetical protein